MKPWDLLREDQQQKLLRGQLRFILNRSREESGKNGTEFIEHIRDPKTACYLFNKSIAFLVDTGKTFAFAALMADGIWMKFKFAVGERGSEGDAKKVIDLPFASVEEMLKFLK